MLDIILHSNNIKHMKKISLLLLVVICIAFAMCTKTDNTPISAFAVNGITYTQGTSQGTHWDPNNVYLYCTNNNKDSLQISFLTKPTVSGNYWVKNDDDTTVPFLYNNCAIDCLIGGGLTHDYHSIGALGDYVSVTVGTGGKLTATFNNVSFMDTTNTVKISGTLIEQ